MQFWVARNRIGFIYLYSIEPIKRDGYFQEQRGCETMCLPQKAFPEINFENSPQEVELKLVEGHEIND